MPQRRQTLGWRVGSRSSCGWSRQRARALAIAAPLRRWMYRRFAACSCAGRVLPGVRVLMDVPIDAGACVRRLYFTRLQADCRPLDDEWGVHCHQQVGCGFQQPIDRLRWRHVDMFRALRPLLEGTSRVADPSSLAILLAMTPSEHVSLADAKNHLSEVVDRLEREHGRVVITKHGRPAVVMLSLEDLESLEETLEILSNPSLVAEIHEAQAEIATGRTRELTRDQAQTLIKRQ